MQKNNNQNCGCSNEECSPSLNKDNQSKQGKVIESILPKVTRKDFLKFLGISPLVSYSAFSQVTKGKGERYKAIPVDKKLSPEWVKSLYQRGKPHVYKEKKDLAYIGMPVGGFCTGTLYLGGDGKLWNWDIFNKNYKGRGHRGIGTTVRGVHYTDPLEPENLENFINEFYLTIKKNGKKTTKTLDYKGFENIQYTSGYPVGKVDYKSKGVKVSLQGYSPFIPLDFKHSSYPATILEYEVENTSNQKTDFALGGILENLVCRYEAKNILKNKNLFKKNTKISGKNYQGIQYQIDFGEEANEKLINKVKNLNGYGSLSLAIIASEGKSLGKGVSVYTHFENLEKREVKNSFTSKCLFREAIGNVEEEFTLAPKQKKKITFVLSWHFKNSSARYYGTKNNPENYYAVRFADSKETIKEISKKYSFLRGKTFQWKELFYEKSNLPYWLLTRSIVTICCLATRTSYFFNDNGEGYFWAWEGVDCCPGTCNHVWQYQQSMARLFPELERNIRTKSTFNGLKSNGAFTYRVEIKENRSKGIGGAKAVAVDGQLGEILRFYRDTLLDKDNKYLKKYWDKIKKAMSYMIKTYDKNKDGILKGQQYNTLDAGWGGEIAWLSSMYLAALKACLIMSKTVGDEKFKAKVSCILEKGKESFNRLFFNDEFFIQKKSRENDLGHSVGCHIDQVYGQGWAFRLGLGRLFDQQKTRTALRNLWKYNFVLDMGDFREEFKLKNSPKDIGNHMFVPAAGRTYAMEDDKALIITSFPYGGRGRAFWTNGYYQEAQSGYEYQPAAHMVWEGVPDLIEKGLAVARGIHDRYFGSPHKRNPYNEIECGDHYARAMSSYGVYLAACGFDYDGPKNEIGFQPRINFDNFKSSFTTESAWGLFSQKVSKRKGSYSLKIVNDSLLLQKVTLAANSKISSVEVKLGGKKISASLVQQENKITNKSIFSVVFSKKVNIKEKQTLEIKVA